MIADVVGSGIPVNIDMKNMKFELGLTTSTCRLVKPGISAKLAEKKLAVNCGGEGCWFAGEGGDIVAAAGEHLRIGLTRTWPHVYPAHRLRHE